MRPRSWPLAARVGALLVLLGGAESARATAPAGDDAPAASQDDYVRVRLAPVGPTPFSSITYEVTWRGPATTAVHRRTLPGDSESLHSLGLLTRAEAATVAALLRTTGAMNLADAAPVEPRAGDLSWEVELQVDGALHSFRCTAPEILPNRQYYALIDGVRRTVKQFAGELPFRNVFFAPDRRGWVTLMSVPAARVSIDGFDTQLATPLYSYELAAGPHTVRLVTADGRFDRSYEVKVEPGGTTNLRVDLR